MSRYKSKEEIEKILKDYYSSGATQNQFAKDNGLNQGTLSAWVRKDKGIISKSTKTKSPLHQGPYKPDSRKQTIETFFKSGLTRQDFSKTWRVSASTLRKWLAQYEKDGPKGLEKSSFSENPKKRGAKGIHPEIKEEIVRIKMAEPRLGIKSVRNFLMRFKGLKVSTGTINKTFKENELKTELEPRKRKRRSEEPRRFERANPMQLWQSDITSFNLPRSGQKVYLTVFLDDCSRYVVAWNLQLRQTQDLVIDSLLSGIERFGKPEEVLTDQGRQYFSWRGKCDFQKLLIKQGIRHVVARSHHPQTVGKCERIWETINKELLDRVRPQTLDEARERLTHFFNHYNHFRPHQGIDGAIPADRFFGVESEIRTIVESNISKNELRLALGESPRSPVFLIGQIGDKPISMHGESGKLVIQTPDGEITNFDYENFGHQKGAKNGREEGSKEKTGAEERVHNATYAGSAGEESVGECDRRAEAAGSTHGDCDHGVLDGENIEGRSGKTSGSDEFENLADVTAGDLGYAGRTIGSTEDASQGSDYGPERQSTVIEEENSGTGSNDSKAGSIDSSATLNAGLSGNSNYGSAEHSSRRDECKQEDKDQDTNRSSR